MQINNVSFCLRLAGSRSSEKQLSLIYNGKEPVDVWQYESWILSINKFTAISGDVRPALCTKCQIRRNLTLLQEASEDFRFLASSEKKILNFGSEGIRFKALSMEAIAVVFSGHKSSKKGFTRKHQAFKEDNFSHLIRGNTYNFFASSNCFL